MTSSQVTVVRGGGAIGSQGEGLLDMTRRLGLGGCAFDASDEDAAAAYATYAGGATFGTQPTAISFTGDDFMGVFKDVDDVFSGYKMTFDNLADGLVALGMVGGLALGGAADKIPYTTGAHAYAETTLSAFGRSLIDDANGGAALTTLGISDFIKTLTDDADAATARATLGLVAGTDVQAFDATLLSLASLGTGANKIAYTTGADTWAETALTAFGRSLIDDADAPTSRTTLGLVIGTDVQAYDAELAAFAGLTSAANKLPYFTGSGTAALADFTAFARSLVDDTDAATSRTTLGLVIGTDVQAFDATLNSIAALGTGANKIAYTTGVDTWAETPLTAAGRALIDDADASAMRTTLGVVIGADVQAYNARLASIAASGIVAEMLGESVFDTDNTLAANSNSRIASQSAVKVYVDNSIAALVASSPSTLDTLNELATALGDDPAFATTVSTALGNRLRFDAAQTLSGGQKTQAQANIGLVIGTDVQAQDATLLSLAGLGTGANKIAYTTGVDTWAETALTAFGRSLIDDADASTARTTLGLVIGTDVQAYDAELAAWAGLTSAANKLGYFTGSGTAAVTDFTAFARTLVDDANQAAMQTTLGLVPGTDIQAFDATLLSLATLGTAANKMAYTTGVDTWAETALTAAGRSLIDDADTATMRTTLGLVIGTDVQAYDAELAAVAGLTSAANKLAYFTGSGTAALADLTAAGRALIDDADASAMRTTLGLVIGTDVAALASPTFTGTPILSTAWTFGSSIGMSKSSNLFVSTGGTSGTQWNNNANNAALMTLSDAGILVIGGANVGGEKLTVIGAGGTATAAFKGDTAAAQIIQTWNAAASGTRTLGAFFTGAGATNVGTITSDGTGVTYGSASAEFLPNGKKNKLNIRDMDPEFARQVVRAMAPKHYTHARDKSPGHGMVVEHVNANLKEIGINGEALGFYNMPCKARIGVMDYGKWTPFLAAVANDHDDILGSHHNILGAQAEQIADLKKVVAGLSDEVLKLKNAA